MALKSGRVGVNPDQVDNYGRLIATDHLIEIIRERLNTNEAEVSALQLAREHALAELQRPVFNDKIYSEDLGSIADPPVEEAPVITVEEGVDDESRSSRSTE